MERQITADAERRYFRRKSGRIAGTFLRDDRGTKSLSIASAGKKERKIRFKINLAAFYTAIVRKFKREPPFVSTDFEKIFLENICAIIFDLSLEREENIQFGRVS